MSGICRISEIEKCWGISIQHEAGWYLRDVIYHSGLPFITSGIDLAKLICAWDGSPDVRADHHSAGNYVSGIMDHLILHLKPADFIKMSMPVEM